MGLRDVQQGKQSRPERSCTVCHHAAIPHFFGIPLVWGTCMDLDDFTWCF